MSSQQDSKERFTDRVAQYVASRPSYPVGTVELLKEEFHISSGGAIADIGSGTGILSSLLITNLRDVRVFGIEPNSAMREAGEQFVKESTRADQFQSVAGTAEKTMLDDSSVDCIVAAQAFHWFNVPETRREFKRVLKPHGGVALIWNERRGTIDSSLPHRAPAEGHSPFLDAYEAMLLRHSKDYQEIAHHTAIKEATLQSFFGPDGYKVASFSNPYELDWEMLVGRLMSSSYAPQAGQLGHDGMMRELKQIFEEHEIDGKVDFIYDTMVFFGRLS